MMTHDLFFKRTTRIFAVSLMILLWLTAVRQAYGQRYLNEAIPYSNEAVLRTDEGFVEITFTRQHYIGRAAPQMTYHSYYRDSVYRTQGGYHGHPLHGRYVERYNHRGLRVLGRYRYGLPVGKWQYWDEHGTLRKVSRWKDGAETGKFVIYNEAGALQQRGYLRDGKFNGSITTYHTGDSTYRERKRYRLGKEVDGNGQGWFTRAANWIGGVLW
ncbi:toxin-antitoxin system YwqK family antitoxin [Parapedobacter composti]|nr:hypothetical protein [Parapedobacter composti]